MRKVVTGEQVAQIYNRDPFALPVWRAPVYQTPLGIILAGSALPAAGLAGPAGRPAPAGRRRRGPAGADLAELGWLGLVGLAAWAVVVLAAWRWFWPASFTRWVAPRPGASGGPGSTGAAGPG